MEGVLNKGLIYGGKSKFIDYYSAFYKSAFMNIIFAFPMMVFHRVTDSLIDKGILFSIWPIVEIYINIDWKNMIRVVGFSCIWFWIPAHTITFLLPSEFRVMSAALLAIFLGTILGYAKKRALNIKK